MRASTSACLSKQNGTLTNSHATSDPGLRFVFHNHNAFGLSGMILTKSGHEVQFLMETMDLVKVKLNIHPMVLAMLPYVKVRVRVGGRS